MSIRLVLVFACLSAGLVLVAQASEAKRGLDECEFIRDALNALPAAGGEVVIPAGTFTCNKMVVMKKSHVKLRGQGQDQTTLKLADWSSSPLLVVGDIEMTQAPDGEVITATRVEDITVSDLTLDGNSPNQDPILECGANNCDDDPVGIRNNGITIRGASQVTVSRVTAHHAVSGGMVTEKYCDHLHVTDFTSYGNNFDGFAGYQTEDSLFENLNLSRNHNAGISIDIRFNNNRFLNGILASNGDVGIFALNLYGVVFENLKITDSGNHGAFLGNYQRPGTCADNNEFRSVTIGGSRGMGLYISNECSGNRVTGASILENNQGGCFNEDGALSLDPSVICR